MNTEKETAKADVDTPVWGAAAIGKIINRSPRQANYLLETGRLPAKKIGDQWVGGARRLLQSVLEGID
jgi:hypothetical protein